MKVLRLPRSKVHLGAPLPWNVRSETGLLLLSKGHLILNAHQLEELLERGAFVDVEEIRASAREEQAPMAPAVAAQPNLFDLWEKTPQALKNLMADPAAHAHADDARDFAAELDQFAGHVLALVDSNADIAIYRSVRQDHAQNYYYGYAHALHTGVLCVLLTRHLHWPAARTRTLLKAALTMNMGIFELQGQMAAQDVPMRDRQRAEIHQHPELAVERLQQRGITDVEWLQAVVQHHEHADGSGYPLGITTICDMAQALRVCDVFMSKITPRVLRPALTPQEAVRQVYQDDHGGPLSNALIKEFGIYPPGDFVKLASGELGVVVQRTDNARAPIVASITDTAGHPVAHTHRHDTGQAAFAIVGTASNPALLARLPPERLYGFARLN